MFDKKLKEIYKEYLVSYINMREYPVFKYAMVKIMAINKPEQNQAVMTIIN